MLLVAAACSTGPGNDVPSTTPGRGAVAIEIIPNPIVATHISGERYEFPLEVVVRETGGRPVTVTRVTASVKGPGGFTVGGDSWDAAKIRSMGYGTTVNANGELRYRFTPRENVPDERLFGSVIAELRVDAVDDAGGETSATTTVTVRKG